MSTTETPQPNLPRSRIELLCDGNRILSTSTASRPANDAEYVAILREIIAVLEAPSTNVTDTEKL